MYDWMSSWRSRMLPLALVIAYAWFGISGTAAADLVFYTDRSAFNADFPGLPLEDFEEGNIGAGSVRGCSAPTDSTTTNQCFSAGDILPGVVFEDEPGPDTIDGLVLIGAGFNGNSSISFGSNTFNDSLNILFTDPTDVVGMDVQTHNQPSNVEITIFGEDNSTVLGSTTVAATNAGTFFGVSSDELIGLIQLTSPSNQAEVVDNLAFGLDSGNSCPATTVVEEFPQAQARAEQSGHGTEQDLSATLPRETTLDTLYWLRDGVLARSPAGRRYISQYYQHAPEGTRLLLRYPGLLLQTGRVLSHILPALESAGDHAQAQLSVTDVEDMDALLKAIAAKASPRLRRTVRRLRFDLRRGKLLRVMGISVETGR